MRTVLFHAITTAALLVAAAAAANAQLSNNQDAVTATAGFVKAVAAQPGSDDEVKRASGPLVGVLEVKLLAPLTEQLKSDVAAGSFCDSAQTCSGATAIAATSQPRVQNGATAASSGSTSATQLPGIPALLGLAVENGSITNNVSGNTMTLSTTLYGLVSSLFGDTEQTYLACGHCSQLGGSATFNLTGTSDPLQQASRRQITQWQVKYTFKDLSSRSGKALTLYTNVGAAARGVVRSLSSPVFNSLQAQLDAVKFGSLIVDTVVAEINATGKAKNSLSDDDENAIAKSVLEKLETNTAVMKVYADALANPLLADKARLYAEATRTFLLQNAQYAKNLTYLANGFNGAATFGQQYPTTTITAGSSTLTTPTYLEGTVILSYKPGPKPSLASLPVITNATATALRPSLTFNGGVTFYPKPITAANEQTFRGGTAALQLQWSIDKRPFSSDPLDKSQTTFSLNGNYTRVQENEHQAGKKADIALGNFKLEIPIGGGVSLPLSVTVASSSQQVKESYVRGNFGLSFDLDKLSALLKAKN